MKTPDSQSDDSLVARLKRWQEDRGALANLRCGLRQTLRARAWPLLGQLTSLEAPSLILFETVAGLWAAAPALHRAGGGNFGATCRSLRGEHESFDLRFRRLLACEQRAELCERLVPIALAAQAQGIPIDYDALFCDLRFYAGEGRERVRVRWAQAYWGAPSQPSGPAAPTSQAASL